MVFRVINQIHFSSIVILFLSSKGWRPSFWSQKKNKKKKTEKHFWKTSKKHEAIHNQGYSWSVFFSRIFFIFFLFFWVQRDGEILSVHLKNKKKNVLRSKGWRPGKKETKTVIEWDWKIIFAKDCLKREKFDPVFWKKDW